MQMDENGMGIPIPDMSLAKFREYEAEVQGEFARLSVTYPDGIEIERTDGTRQTLPAAVDCSASAPGFGEPCHLKPYWVIQKGEHFRAACPIHLGNVVSHMLPRDEDFPQDLTFHLYKGE